MDNKIKQTFKQVEAMNIWDETTPIDFNEYQKYINEEAQEELESLLFRCEDSDYVANMKFDDLTKLPFENAHNVINQFSMPKRIQMLEALTTHRAYLYDQLSRYGAKLPREEQLSAKDYKIIMGKVKHVEILQGWLYGIN